MRWLKNNYIFIFKALLFVGIIYFPLFIHLEYFPIRIWDESRLAMNAYEMHENGNFIVTYYNGNPDMWNTKPPLMIWFQVFFIWIFGVGELAIRLPSALAAALTCLLILLFSIKYLKSYLFGIITVLILVTSEGYVSVHGTRTGDYDSLLVFFHLITCLSYYSYLHSNSTKHIYLYSTVLGLTFAVLTKGVAGLLFLPALFFFTLFEKQFHILLKSKHFYIGLLLFIALISGYYLWRENLNSGYLKAVYNNELGGRYIKGNEGHQHEFWFYLKKFFNERLKLWIWFVPLGFVAGFISNDKRIKKLTFYLLVLVIQFFLVISIGKTKLRWYDMSLYPLFSFVIAFFIYYVFLKIRNVKQLDKNVFFKSIPYILLFLLFYNSYYKSINKGRKPKEYYWDIEFYNISYYLKNAVKNEKEFGNCVIAYKGYNAHLLFYTKILNDAGQNIQWLNKEELKPDMKVIADQVEMKEYIDGEFNYNIIESYKNVMIYKLLNRKSNE